MSKILFIILVIILIGFNSIAFIIQSDFASIKYWASIGWINFLIIINWLTSASIFNVSNKESSDGTPGNIIASLPGISFVLLFFSIVSVIIIIFYNYHILSFKYQLILQIATIVLSTVIMLLMHLSSRAAGYGAESKISKSDLLVEYNRLLRLCNDDKIRDLLKEVVNYVSYKMPHPSKLSQDDLVHIYNQLKNIDQKSVLESEEILSKIKNI